MWLLRWARAGAEEQMWAQLGYFSGLVCAGSIAGCVAWSARLLTYSIYYESKAHSISHQHSYTLVAAAARWGAAFFFSYGFEFACLIVSKLQLLGRLADNAAQRSRADVADMNEARRAWLNGPVLVFMHRIMAALVALGGVVGMVALDTAGDYALKEAALLQQAALSCDASGNDTNSSLTFLASSNDMRTIVYTAQSVQVGTEALTLLFVTAAYVVVVTWSVAIFRIAENLGAQALTFAGDRSGSRHAVGAIEGIISSTMHAAAQQRRRLTAACLVVLVTFPARAAFDLLDAYSLFNDPPSTSCSICDPCQPQPVLIRQWIMFTPEFQPIVVALSSPLPLTLSLWLITEAHARARLIAADVQRELQGL